VDEFGWRNLGFRGGAASGSEGDPLSPQRKGDSYALLERL